LNPDGDTLCEQYSMLNREREEMTREHDELITRYQVMIKKVNEKKKLLTETLDDDLSAMETQIKEIVLETKSDAAAGDFAFGYSETPTSDTKRMIRDSAKSPKLAAILGRYLSKRPSATKRSKR
jgi:hypothetical protein